MGSAAEPRSWQPPSLVRVGIEIERSRKSMMRREEGVRSGNEKRKLGYIFASFASDEKRGKHGRCDRISREAVEISFQLNLLQIITAA